MQPSHSTQPSVETLSRPEILSSVETRSGDDIAAQSLEDIHTVEAAISAELGLKPGSIEAVHETDAALVHIAEASIDHYGSDSPEARDAIEDVLYETAAEAETPWVDLMLSPALVMESHGRGDQLQAVVELFEKSHVPTPLGHEAGALVKAAIIELHDKMPQEAGEAPLEYVEKQPSADEVYDKKIEQLTADQESMKNAKTIESRGVFLLVNTLVEQSQGFDIAEIDPDKRMDTINARAYEQLAETQINVWSRTKNMTPEGATALRELGGRTDWNNVELEQIDNVVQVMQQFDSVIEDIDPAKRSRIEIPALTNEIPSEKLRELYDAQINDKDSELKHFLSSDSNDALVNRVKARLFSSIYATEGGAKLLPEGQDSAVDAFREKCGVELFDRVEAFDRLAELPSRPESAEPEVVLEYNDAMRKELGAIAKTFGMPAETIKRYSLASSQRLSHGARLPEEFEGVRVLDKQDYLKSMRRIAINVEALGGDRIAQLCNDMGVVNIDKYRPEDLETLEGLRDGDPVLIESLQAGDVMVNFADAFGDHNGAFTDSFNMTRRESGRSIMFEVESAPQIYRRMVQLKQLGIKPSSLVIGAHGAPGITVFGSGPSGFSLLADESLRSRDGDVNLGDARIDRLLSDEFMQTSRSIDDPGEWNGYRQIILDSCSGAVAYENGISTTEAILGNAVMGELSTRDLEMYAATDVVYSQRHGDDLLFRDETNKSIAARFSATPLTDHGVIGSMFKNFRLPGVKRSRGYTVEQENLDRIPIGKGI